MNTRLSPARPIIRCSIAPERSPVNGMPVRSPPKRPGAIPTNITRARASPLPGTTRDRHRTSAGHRMHPSIKARSVSSAKFAAMRPGACLADRFDSRGAAAFDEKPRTMLEAIAFVTRSRANFLGVGVEFRVEPLDVDSAAFGLHVVEQKYRLRQQIDRGLTATTLEAKMKGGGDTVERSGERLQFIVERRGGIFELLGCVEVLAPIERLDRLLELLVHWVKNHAA